MLSRSLLIVVWDATISLIWEIIVPKSDAAPRKRKMQKTCSYRILVRDDVSALLKRKEKKKWNPFSISGCSNVACNKEISTRWDQIILAVFKGQSATHHNQQS
jgi:hypothetical protein